MTRRRTTTGAERGYKRSWRNLLLNKRYQLSFTFFMVGIATALMVGLGFWVMSVAHDTMDVSATFELGRCREVPVIESPHRAVTPSPVKLPDEPPAPPPTTRPGIQVTLDDIQMPEPGIVEPRVPSDFKEAVVEKWTCQLGVLNAIDNLERGRRRILWVLIGTGVALAFGLAVYGLKMTHRVAGPLHKMQQYFRRMRDGRFEKVIGLRKGDQLLDFYGHFQRARDGVVEVEREDVERIRATIAAAERAGLGDHPSIAELRDLAARKENGFAE